MSVFNMSSDSLVRNRTIIFVPAHNALNASNVLHDLGPSRDSLTTVIPMTLVYAIILVTGVVGNFCTCIVIARNKYMHTATNYYLFSLAVSDQLLLILGLPQELYQLWIRYPYAFGEPLCVLRGLTSETSTNASILTITAFTVERYVAICHPLRAHTMSQLPRAIRTILVIWTVAALCAIPLAMQLGIIYHYDDSGRELWETAQCTIKRPLAHSFEVSTFLFFVFPISVISVLYVFIGIRLRQSSLGRRATSPEHDGDSCSRQNLASRRAVVKMLVAVVVAFFICWTPFHAQRLMAIFVANSSPAAEMTFMILTYISGVTYYLSATVNPIFYQVMSHKFRQAFKDTFVTCTSDSKRNPTLNFSMFGNSHSLKTIGGGSTRKVGSNCNHHQLGPRGSNSSFTRSLREPVSQTQDTLLVPLTPEERSLLKENPLRVPRV